MCQIESLFNSLVADWVRWGIIIELFQGLKKSFKKKRVVNDINMIVERGEIFGILGPNQAGKTAILNMITANLHPDKGKVGIETLFLLVCRNSNKIFCSLNLIS